MRGVCFTRLGHHSKSAMKHGGHIDSSISQFHAPHCFSFISPHTQPFTLSSLISLHSFFPSLWPNYFFSLQRSSCPLSPPPFLYTVQHNFPSSSCIISRISSFISLFLSLILQHTLLFLRTALHPTPSPSVPAIFTYECPWVKL